METISRTLEKLEVGAPSQFRNLTVFPLLLRGSAETDYLTLDEALAAGTARVTEVRQGGSVPELRLLNEGDRPVLLLDGEELVGAKQNRVLNLTILAPPRSEIVIPVSCVEAGRWDAGLQALRASPQVMYRRARADKARQVTCRMAVSGIPRSDQGAVWRNLAEQAARLNVNSPTSAMDEIFRRYEGSIQDYVQAIRHERDQVGAVFAIDGRVLGLELLDHAETMGKLLPKLVRSYALDAIGSAVDLRQQPPAQSVRDFMEEVSAAETRRSRAIGLGEDVRLSATGLAGGALVDRERVVHLSAFRLDEDAGAGDGEGRKSRMQSLSERLRKFRNAS